MSDVSGLDDAVIEKMDADVDSPLVITPRGGTREVGRSCYQVSTEHGTYLVDCGLKQQEGGSVGFPDFRGLGNGGVDAVLLTHAHIDHIGALPILEHDGYLSHDAPIICTRPTAALAHTLLHDSLKIHKATSKAMSREQRFTKDDLLNVLDRFEPISYGEYTLNRFLSDDDEDITFRLGNAGHLLGSAWLAVEAGGRRVVFSGDIGGRSAHLPDVETPPSADLLLLESTYGDRDTHSSFRDARTTLYNTAMDAIKNDIPVLIPSFAVGRAQEVMQIFRERWRGEPEEVREKLEIIYDGMSIDATDAYHAYANGAYVSEAIQKYRMNASDHTPFVPDCAWRPSNSRERKKILNGENAPIIVSPSGMMTGGLSPLYLLDLIENYDEARVIFTGYQAPGTPGNQLQSATGDIAEVTLNTTGWGGSADDDGTTTVEVPTDWVTTVSGLSGHAARNKLLQFARSVDAGRIDLIHGDSDAQREFVTFLQSNTNTSHVGQTKFLTPIQPSVIPESFKAAEDGSEPATTPPAESEQKELEELSLEEQVDHLKQRIVRLEADLAAARNDDGWTEGELREMIREELNHSEAED